MSLYDHEVIKINLSLMGARLLSEPDQVARFSASVGEEVVPVGANLVFRDDQRPLEHATRLELPKDRIAIVLGANGSGIERAYPSTSDLPRLTEVVTLAADSSELGDALPTAHGYNLEMVYRQDSGENAHRYLGQRLFGGDAFAAQGWSVDGGAGRLNYESPDGRWEFIVEPRFRARDTDKVFLLLNLHRELPGMPSREDIVASFKLLWDQAHELGHRIDRGTHT